MKKILSIMALWLAVVGMGRTQNIWTNFETGIISLPVKDEATHNMIREVLKETDPLTRVQALAALKAIGDPADLPLIKASLNDPVETVREQAKRALPGFSINQNATEHSPVLALAQTLDGSPSVSLIHEGLTNPVVVIQQAAADAMGRQHVAELAPALLPLLKSPDSVLRRHVCEALGKSGNDQGTALAEQLAGDEDQTVKHAAGDALVALHTDADREALLALLKNTNGSVRMETAMALGKWAQPSIAVSLHPLLVDPDTQVSKAAAEALGRLGNPDSKQALMAVFTNTQTMAQERMAWALGELHANEAVPLLEYAVNKMWDITQPTAVEALGKIGDPHAIPTLQKVLVDVKEHNPITRQRAIEVLQQLGDRASVPRIMQIITEKVIPPPPGTSEWSYDMDETRAAGVRYLGFIGDLKLADEMLGKLKVMPTYKLRKAMAAVIGQLTGKPMMAAFSSDCRHYWIESLDEDTVSKSPTGTGIVPAGS